MNELIVGILESSRGIVPLALTFSFLVSFSLIIVYLVTNFGYMKKQFNVRKLFWVILILIILLGLGLRIITPIFFPTYIDEVSNIEVSKNIIRYGQPLICEYQGPEKISCSETTVSATFNYLLSIFFIFLGVGMQSAYIATMIIGLLTVIMVSVSVYLLFKNEKIALWSGLFISIFPLYILQSRTLEKDTTFVLFIFLSVFAFTLLSKRMDFKTGIFAVASLMLAISAKQEGIILFPIFFILVLLFFDFNFIKRFYRSKKLWCLVLLFVILIIPHIVLISIQIYPNLFYGKQTAYGELSLANIGNNIWALESFAGSQYPWIFNLFIIIGVLYSVGKFRKELVFLSLFFFLMLVMYMTYGYGIRDEKYILMIYPPLVILGGVGLFYLENLLTGIISKRTDVKKFSKYVLFAVPFILAAMILVLFMPYFDELDDTMPLNLKNGNPRDEIFYHENIYVESINAKLGDAYVVTELPLVLAGTSVKPISTSNFLSQFKNADPEELFGKIYYFEDLFCTDFFTHGNRCGVENQSHETCEDLRIEELKMCDEMHDRYKLVVLLEHTFNVSENIRLKYEADTNIASFHVYEIKGRKT